MEATLNPALQAILDSLNESSNRSMETVSTVNANPRTIPGLDFLPDAPAPTPAPPMPKLERAPPTPKPRIPEPKSRTVTPLPDASEITTWPSALKHVTKHIGPNETIGAKIRQLVSDQHNHEKQWWAGREAIIQKHRSRVDNQQQAADLLKSIGGIPITLRPINEGNEKTELEVYDKKVYAELVKMTASYDRQLRAMGIPFYAIKHELVIMGEGQARSDTKGLIDRGELRELQKRMLQHLEDLFLDS